MSWMSFVQPLLFSVAGLLVGCLTDRALRRFVPSWRPVGLPIVTSCMWAVGAMVGAGTATFAFLSWCACLTCIDVGSRRLPNLLTAAGAVAVLVYAATVDGLGAALVGGTGLFCCYLTVHVGLPAAFGAGDVKLAFALGAVAASVGTDAWVAAALLAPLLTGVTGLVFAALQRHGSGACRSVPHGPSMCLATLLVMAAPMA
ncbi:MAG: A24 family peptidase [Rhodococcus sp. (in: high G+C Gram-positive bacteria)]